MNHRILFACLALLAACGGRSPSPSPAPLPSPVVVPANPIVGLGTHSLDLRSLEELRSLGITHTRTTLYVALWEIDGAYREDFAAGVRRAAAWGFRLLVVVHQVPDGWEAQTFAGWLGERAEEIGYAVESWQIGNEAWSRPGNLPVAKYAHWYTSAHIAIKAASPHALVVTTALPDEEYAKALYGLIRPDAFAVHIYGLDLAAETKRRREWLPPSARVWMTEVGIEERVIPADAGPWEDAQAREIQAAVEAARGYERSYIYQLRTQEPAETHGLIRPDGTLRPAAVWLRSISSPPP